MKAWIHYFAGDFDQAIAAGERVFAADSSFTIVDLILGNANRYLGRHDLAANAYARFFGTVVPGEDKSIRSAYTKGGIDAAVRVLIKGARQAGQTQYVSPASIGYWYASIGEADSAMVWLEKAYHERAYPIEFAAVTPDCQPIRDDPRFLDLIERLKLEDVKPAYVRN